jgi:SSS family solute:Na+ symporter
MSSGAWVLFGLIAAVCVLGFFGRGWGNANLAKIDEWALGGRGFGTLLSWFLVGGDIYTAYTFIAVPALVYGVGALGFFPLALNFVAYPVALVFLVRFWGIARKRGYVTGADFVRDRFGDRSLEIAIALTGAVALMPYIALQLVGMQVVFAQLGGVFAVDKGIPAFTVAFLLVAANTYVSGLRAPALIAVVKDTLIYVTVVAAILVIPAKLGGWQHIFASVQTALSARPKGASVLLTPPQYFTYATMAIGSGIALFLYPSSITSILAARSKDVLRRNAVLLPIYTLLLGFLGLLGYCAIAAGISVAHGSSAVIPLLFAKYFPDWFAGLAGGAIVIGALVPATIMCIGAANLLASNVFREFASDRMPLAVSVVKTFTLVMCAGGLFVVFVFPVTFAIDFQLLGGSLIVQTFPAFGLGLFTRWFHPRALLAGWAVGIAVACAMAYAAGFASTYAIDLFGLHLNGFIAVYSLTANLVVAAVGTAVLRVIGVPAGNDRTLAADYS